MKRKQITSIDYALEPLKKNWAVAEIKVSYKPAKRTQVIVSNSNDAYRVLKAMWDEDMLCLQEQFAVLFLNTAKEVIGYRVICTGTQGMVSVDYSLIISLCFLCRARTVILAHNHPSGNTEPSEQDIFLTRKLQYLLKEFEYEVLDHLIITDLGFYSFVDNGVKLSFL